MSRWRALLALALGFLVLHNLEELIAAPAYVDRILGGFELVLPRGRAVRISAEVYASLAWATLLPALLLAWAARARCAEAPATPPGSSTEKTNPLAPGAVLLGALRALQRAPGKGAFAACWLQVVLLANAVVPHLALSVARHAYTPGVVTAALVNVPFGVFFLRHARAEGRISRRGLGWAVALGVALYPVAIASVYLLGHLSLAALAAAGIL